MSLTCWLGIYYEFILGREVYVKQDKDGKLLPREHLCHMRFTLKTSDVSLQMRNRVLNPLEQDRDDVWWVDPDGANLEIVLFDIRESFLETAVPWLREMTDLENVLEKVRGEADCWNKYWRAMYLAEIVGCTEEAARYRALYEEETRRIEQVLGRSDKRRKKSR